MHWPAASAFLLWMGPALSIEIMYATEELKNEPHPHQLVVSFVRLEAEASVNITLFEHSYKTASVICFQQSKEKFVLFQYKYPISFTYECVKIKFKTNQILHNCFQRLLSILCPVKVVMYKPEAMVLALQNDTHLNLSPLRTNFRLKNECCSLSNACWRI